MQHTRTRVVLITGNGKGKTTSALGMVLRAAGQGLRVEVIHFIKQRQDTGEACGLAYLPGVHAHACGLGFVRERSGSSFEAHVQAANTGLAQAAENLRDPEIDMVLLDEVCGAVSLGLLSNKAVCEVVTHAMPGKIVILTGRAATPELEALADTVSYITAVRHAYHAGWPAQAGVEF